MSSAALRICRLAGRASLRACSCRGAGPRPLVARLPESPPGWRPWGGALSRRHAVTSASAPPASRAAREEEHAPVSFHAHLDFRALRGCLPLHEANARARGVEVDFEALKRALDGAQRLRNEVEAARAERNAVAKALGAGRGGLAEEEALQLKSRGAALKEASEAAEHALRREEDVLQRLAQRVPNMTDAEVVAWAGKAERVQGQRDEVGEGAGVAEQSPKQATARTESSSARSSPTPPASAETSAEGLSSIPPPSQQEARLVRLHGSQRAFSPACPPRSHEELARGLGALEPEAASRCSGPRFAYLLGPAARLETALQHLALDRAVAAGFVAVSTPDLVKSHVLERCGFSPRGQNTQIYRVLGGGGEGADEAGDPGAHSLCLTGTAEVPLLALHMDQVLDQAALPMRLAGVGHCFRTEAGAGGAAGRGLYRLHQFTKVELVVLSRPQDSPAVLEELLCFERELYRDLGLCFRELDMPPADLGAPAARKIDMEAWMPGLARWGEISSASNCTDYQARRLGIRFRPDAPDGHGSHGKRAPAQFVHTLNATAAAVPRLLLALLENGQRADGGVDLPDVLAPYMGGQVRLDKRGE